MGITRPRSRVTDVGVGKSIRIAGIAAAVALFTWPREAEAVEWCDPTKAVAVEVKTSTRQSHVAIQPCFWMGNGTITPYVKWRNMRGGLDCAISFPPSLSCQLTSGKSAVDFHDVRVEVHMIDPKGRWKRWGCSPPVSEINAAESWGDYSCWGPQFSAKGTYQVGGYTEFDVKDDGKGWIYFSSGTAVRNLGK